MTRRAVNDLELPTAISAFTQALWSSTISWAAPGLFDGTRRRGTVPKARAPTRRMLGERSWGRAREPASEPLRPGGICLPPVLGSPGPGVVSFRRSACPSLQGTSTRDTSRPAPGHALPSLAPWGVLPSADVAFSRAVFRVPELRDFQVFSSSPELFLRVGVTITSPPPHQREPGRGMPIPSATLHWPGASAGEKENAELVMIHYFGMTSVV